jgi:hypothetical protein
MRSRTELMFHEFDRHQGSVIRDQDVKNQIIAQTQIANLDA